VHDALRDALAVEMGVFLEKLQSCTSSGPRSPAVNEFWLSATGIPAEVVSCLSAMLCPPK
jgi:hypothetical protein